MDTSLNQTTEIFGYVLNLANIRNSTLIHNCCEKYHRVKHYALAVTHVGRFTHNYVLVLLCV